MENKTKLVPYMSKVTPEIKGITSALVATRINGCASQHELIKDMLRVYEEAYPQAFEKAKAFLEFMEEEPQKIYEE